jgi:hypothetical protein
VEEEGGGGGKEAEETLGSCVSWHPMMWRAISVRPCRG